jgi:hypothetical protein
MNYLFHSLKRKKKNQRRNRKHIKVIPALEGAIIALVTDTNEGTGTHIRVTDNTLAITLLTQPPYRYTRLLPAHYKIGVVLCHLLPLPLILQCLFC